MNARVERVLLAAEALAALDRVAAKRPRLQSPMGVVAPRTPSTASEAAAAVAASGPAPSPVADDADAALPLIASALDEDELVTAIVNAANSNVVLTNGVLECCGGPVFVLRSAVDCVRLLLLHEGEARKLLAPPPCSPSEVHKCALFVLLGVVIERLDDAFVGRREALRTRPAELALSLKDMTEKLAKTTFRIASPIATELIESSRSAHRVASRTPPDADLGAIVVDAQRVVASSRTVEIVAHGALLQSSTLFAKTRSP